MELAHPRTQNTIPGLALLGIALILVVAATLVGAIPTPGAAGIQFGECLLEARTDCTGEDLSGADLSTLVLRNSVFDYASFENAILSDTLLSGASLQYSYWLNANTTGIVLDRADLTGSTISQEQLDAAASCHRAILPEGLVCNK